MNDQDYYRETVNMHITISFVHAEVLYQYLILDTVMIMSL